MTKGNLVYILGGTVIGLIFGVQIAVQNPGKFHTAEKGTRPPAPIVMEQQAPEEGTAPQEVEPAQTVAKASQEQKSELPKGHPQIDFSSIQKEIASMEEAVRKNPNNQTAIVALANLNADSGDMQKAAIWYQKAVENDPDNVALITDLGTCYLQMQDFDRAMQLYKQSLSLSPNHYQTLVNLGIAHMAVGDKKSAADAWEKITVLYPNDPKIDMIKKAVAEMRASS